MKNDKVKLGLVLAIDNNDDDLAFDHLESHFSIIHLLLTGDDGTSAIIRTTMDDFGKLTEKFKNKLSTFLTDHYEAKDQVLVNRYFFSASEAEFSAFLGTKDRHGHSLVPHVAFKLVPIYAV